MKWNHGNMLLTAISVVFLTCLLMAGSAVAETGVGAKVMEKDGLGKYLTDGKGMTLYTFDMDSPGKSSCTGDCLANWPPFYVKAELVVEGCEKSDFNSMTREDGIEQSTYKGKSLYYFSKDEQPGDTKGHGVKNVWWIVTP